MRTITMLMIALLAAGTVPAMAEEPPVDPQTARRLADARAEADRQRAMADALHRQIASQRRTLGMLRDQLADLMKSKRDLAERLNQAADRLDEDGHVNGLGVVQHRGSEIDRQCGVYRLAAKTAERMQKAAGIDPNA